MSLLLLVCENGKTPYQWSNLVYTQYGCLVEVAFDDVGFAVISHSMKVVQQGDVDIVERRL